MHIPGNWKVCTFLAYTLNHVIFETQLHNYYDDTNLWCSLVRIRFSFVLALMFKFVFITSSLPLNLVVLQNFFTDIYHHTCIDCILFIHFPAFVIVAQQKIYVARINYGQHWNLDVMLTAVHHAVRCTLKLLYMIWNGEIKSSLVPQWCLCCVVTNPSPVCSAVATVIDRWWWVTLVSGMINDKYWFIALNLGWNREKLCVRVWSQWIAYSTQGVYKQ